MRIIQKSGFGLFILVVATVISKSIACAGDYASREIIGFSPDGGYFAFEQYGLQDGSGFPYSDIFIINTHGDAWVPGTPVRVLLKDENLDVEHARSQAKRNAQRLLKRFKIGAPGEHLASNPRAEVSADPHRVAINAAYNHTPPSEDIVRFSLAEKVLTSGECAKYSDLPIKGFRLTMQPKGKKAIVMQDDETLSKSRGCPLGYTFADIYRYRSDDAQTYVVLLHMQQHGFEGPDSRFLAVTRRLR